MNFLRSFIFSVASLLACGLSSAQSSSNSPPTITPPLGVSRTLALYGDSFMANAGMSASQGACGTVCQYATPGTYATWALFYSNYRLTLPDTYLQAGKYSNCGVYGTTTTQILANIGCVLALKPDVVLLEGGTNDVASSASCATIVTNLRAMYATLKSSGISVIRTGIIPRTGGLAFTTAQANVAQCVNEYDRRYAEGTNTSYFTFVDLDPYVIDYAQTTWTIKTGYIASDNVHPSSIGGSVMGNAIAQVINQVVPNWRSASVVPGDVYDVTNNPSGNLLAYGGMTGTAGNVITCTGTAVGGTITYAYASVAGNPGTCVSSIGSQANGQQSEVLTLSGTSGVNGYALYRQFVISPSNISTNDVMEGTVSISLGTNTNIVGINFVCDFMESSVHYTIGSSAPIQSTGDILPSAGYAVSPIMLITVRRVISATPTQVFCDVRVYPNNSSAVSGAVNIYGMALRKVLK